MSEIPSTTLWIWVSLVKLLSIETESEEILKSGREYGEYRGGGELSQTEYKFAKFPHCTKLHNTDLQIANTSAA